MRRELLDVDRADEPGPDHGGADVSDAAPWALPMARRRLVGGKRQLTSSEAGLRQP